METFVTKHHSSKDEDKMEIRLNSVTDKAVL